MKIEIRNEYIEWLRSFQSDITDGEIEEIVNETLIQEMFNWKNWQSWV